MEIFRHPRFQIAVAAIALLTTLSLVIYRATASATPSPGRSVDTLLEDASSTKDTAAEVSLRRQAARDLVRQAGEATDALRHLANESPDSVVRGTAMRGLGKAEDWDSVPMLLDALEDPDPFVRGQAGASLKKIFKADFGFRANDPASARADAVKEWHRRYELVRSTYRPDHARK